MALTKSIIESQLGQFFDQVGAAIGSEAADKALPLIGAVDTLPGGDAAAHIFDALKAQIIAAIEAEGEQDGLDVADLVIKAITDLGIVGISAAKTDTGGVDLSLDVTKTTSTTATPLDIGASVGGFLDLTVNAGADVAAKLDADLIFSGDGSFAIKDQADPELSVNVTADLSIAALAADLGVVKVRVTDGDPTAPELSATFAIDLASGPADTITFDSAFDADAALDLKFESTDALAGLLPDVSGRLVVDFPLVGDVFGSPTVALQDVTLDLESYFGVVNKTIGEIGTLFNAAPLGTVIDLALAPVPVLDDLNRTFGLGFDVLGSITGGPDGILTIADLAAAKNPALRETIDPFYRVIKIIGEIRKLGNLAALGTIDVGGGTLAGGVTTPANDPAAIQNALKAELNKIPGLSQATKDFLTDFSVDTPGSPPPGGGFSFGLLEHPGDILKLLLSDDPVDLVTFDVPALTFDTTAGGFFPVLGPLGFVLEGHLGAKIDFDIGYDTKGLISGNPFEGFLLTTAMHNPMIAPLAPGEAFEPVGSLNTTITGGAGVGFAGSRLSVDANFHFGLYAYFNDVEGDGKFRPTSNSLDCIFSPVGGTADVSLVVTIKIGFGPFSITKHIPLAEAALGDFTLFKCPEPSIEATPLAPGLATAIASDLFLNVGPRADQRKIVDDSDGVAKFVADVDHPLNEGYVIARARNYADDGIDPTDTVAPTLVPGLDVLAYGFTQRFGDPSLNLIKADFSDGDDRLVIQSDVTTGSDVFGGNGADSLTGGAGVDNLHGDNDDDVLSGNGGNDFLYGGEGNDQLSGGRGGDLLDGGNGFDFVDYSAANRDIKIGVTITLSDTGYTGSGGEADGDTFVSIENVIGTDYRDDIRATGASFGVYLEGGLGDDILIGGNGNDLLLGGAGADLLNGQGSGGMSGIGDEDGTTYITSWHGVDIDLQRAVQHLGDAEGDKLFSIEDVQGTVEADTLLGSVEQNALDSGDGNDVIDGRGGGDTITAGDGNDTVFGRGDASYIDAGPGYDTLTYENVAGPVTVDLGATQNSDGSFTGAAPDHIVMSQRLNGGVRGISTFESLIGSQSGDTLTGDTADNRIEGRDGGDVIRGDAGADHLAGGEGADFIDGGAGLDWVEYGDSGAGVRVDLDGLFGIGSGSGGTAEGDALFANENLLGSRFADMLKGNALDNIIDPNISGRAVTEDIDGRFGTDTLRLDYSGVEADHGRGVVGGFGALGSTSGTLTRLTADGLAALDTVTFASIERLDVVGTVAADTIIGGAGDDRIVTGSGGDLIFAGTGADLVVAGNGGDNVAYGAFSFLSDDIAPPTVAVFKLNGGRGIDTLSVAISTITEDVVIEGRTGPGEFRGANFTLSNGAAALNFERLGAIRTGSGNDTVTQSGAFANDFRTGDGNDIITPGLGIDTVDGGYNTAGLTPVTINANQTPVATLLDAAAVRASSGDLLVLDYSSLAADQRVVANVELVFSLLAQTGDATFSQTTINTNNGRYLTLDIGTYGASGVPVMYPDEAPNDVRFTNIERLNVIGSDQNDLLVGTDSAFSAYDFLTGSASSQTPGGDDVLNGGDGDDFIFGQTGDDIIGGGDGNDVLIGTNQVSDSNGRYDPQESDTLTGGDGADTFVAGLAGGVLYRSSDPYNSDPGRAIITDFDASEGDVIQLNGSAIRYRLVETAAATEIYYKDGIGGLGDRDEFVAQVNGVFGLDLESDAFTYVDGTSLSAIVEPAVAALSVSPAEDTASSGTPLPGPQAITALDAFSVTQESDAGVLKASLDGSSGATASSLTLSGSAEAFGTFSGDPFGLGSGIILSTGAADDLPGPNTAESGGSNVTSIPITFMKIGRTGNTDIYMADLSGLGSDLRSIKLTDSNSKLNGGGGIASGFDLSAIVLSHTKLPVQDNQSVDNPITLPRLDVFDFSNAGVTFEPGTQRPKSGFDVGPNLLGSDSNALVKSALIGFDMFAETSPNGSLSLGDGGSVGFDLTQPVSSAGPLYLYLAESGGSGEYVTGTIDVSSDTVEPTGDLSTDLGATGPGGDQTSLTYHFTPKAGDTAFALNAVFFSEELPEFDGTALTDEFSIKLNGVEIGALSNGNSLSIKSLVYSGSGDLIANPVGTGPLADVIRADAYTRTLAISGNVLKGVDNVLTIEVKDGRDAYLDSGILIQHGSFRTFVKPALIIDGGTGGAAPGEMIDFTISLPAGTTHTEPVIVTVDPTGNLDFGAGPGAPITVTFDPDDNGPRHVPVTVVPGSDPNDDGYVDFTVDSEDPDFDGLPVPPAVVDVLPPSPEQDPALIFTRLSGDVIPGFTAGNDVVDGTSRAGPTSFFSGGDTSGKDTIRGFGKADILIVDEKIFDGNNDGFITFGRNGVLDLDGPDKGIDTLRFVTSPKAQTGLRYIGTDGDGHFVYADRIVRPLSAREGSLSNDTLSGDAGDQASQIFFFDTNLDVNWAEDTISNFGGKDFLVTTSKLFDADNNGSIVLATAGVLDLNGSTFFDPAHGADQSAASPFGRVHLTDVAGNEIPALSFDGVITRGSVDYFVYSAAQLALPVLQFG